MLQIHTNSLRNTYRPYDLQGISMPSADKAERIIRHALKWPDQVDIWDRVYLYAYRDNQIYYS